MALARVKTWNPGDTLTAADLNGEFNNILNNPVVLVDPVTARGNLPTAGTNGRLATVSDTMRGLWMDSGSVWFGINGEVVNVKNFGAVGDGVTDDTTAIQSALNAAVALQASALSNGGTTVIFPVGVYQHTSLTLAPTTGLISVNLVGVGRGSVLRYTGAGGTALTVKNDTQYEIRGLRLLNAGSGTTTGLAFQSLAAGSSNTLGLISEVLVGGFTNNYHIGTTTDLAASELTFVNCRSDNTTTGVLIEGINSISVQFLQFGAVTNTTAVKLAMSTASDNYRISFDGVAFSGNTTDFDLQAPAFVSIRNIHTEGNTAGWKFLNTATSPAAAPPLFLVVESVNNNQSQSANWVAGWAGSYTFRNVDTAGTSLTAGDLTVGDRFQIDIYGRDVPIAYVAGGRANLFVTHWPGATNNSNNQSVANLSVDYFLDGGTKQTLFSFPWSTIPPAGGLVLNQSLQVGTPTGGDKGAGTINAAGAYYANGSSGITKTFSITSTGTIIVTNGIITSVTT